MVKRKWSKENGQKNRFLSSSFFAESFYNKARKNVAKFKEKFLKSWISQ